MSVQVLCPKCSTVAEWHRPPVTVCGACQSQYPDALRENAERALRRSAAPMPALVAVGGVGSALVGGLFVAFLILAPFNVGSYTINGQPVSGPEFLRQAGVSFALVGLVLLGIAIGIWREQSWARPLMLSYWIAVPLAAIAGIGWDWTDLVGVVVTSALSAAIAAWYLYGRANVRAYFEART